MTIASVLDGSDGSGRASAAARFSLLLALAVLLTVGIGNGVSAGASDVDLPIAFEQNLGQAGDDTLFLARGKGHRVLLSPQGATFVTRGTTPHSPSYVRLSFEGSAPEARMDGIEPLPGRVHYLVGSNPGAWLSNVPTFAGVRYRGLLPGANVTFRGTRRQISMEIRLGPDRDPDLVSFGLSGARRLEFGDDGALQVRTGSGELKLSPPSAWQLVDGTVVKVPVSFATLESGRFGFILGEFDKSSALEIAVPITVSERNSKPREDDAGFRVAAAEDGSLFVAGQVLGAAGPQPVRHGQDTKRSALELGDAFAAKLDDDGKTLLWSAYFGGEAEDVPRGLELDPAGRAVVVGSTDSDAFPTTEAFQRRRAGEKDAFVVKFRSDGSGFEYASYLGGALDDEARSVAVDRDGNAWVAGVTDGTGFPVSDDALQLARGGGRDAFLARIASDGSRLDYASYLGGAGNESAHAIEIDEQGEVIVAGETGSIDFPTFNPWQPEPDGRSEAFVTRLSADGTRLVFSTYLGGSGADVASALALGARGRVHVAGWTSSADFAAAESIPRTRAGSHGGTDGFVAGIAPDGAFLYLTYLGGSEGDRATGIAADGKGRVLLTGVTRSIDFPFSSPARSGRSQGMGAFVAELSEDGTKLVEASALGSSGETAASGIAMTSEGSSVVVGATSAEPGLEAGTLEPSASGGDAFVASSGGDESTTQLTCTMNFVGGDETHPNRWDIANNWVPSGIPGASDTVCIDGTDYVILYSSTEAIDALEITGSGLLELNHTWGVLDIASASVVGGAGMIIHGGTVTGAGDITFNGPLQFKAGHLEGTGDAIINGNMTMSAGTVRYLARRLVNNSTAVLSYGGLHLDTGAIFENESGGTFDFQGDGLQVAYNSGSPQFNNRGTLIKSAGTGAAHIGHSILFVNTGSVDVQTGTLEIRGMDATHSGSFDCTGATIDWWGDPAHTLDATSSLTGTEVIFSGADVTVLGAYDVDATRIDSNFSTVTFDSPPTMNTLDLLAGILTGTADIVPNGMITWNAGIMEGTGDTIVNNGMTIGVRTVRYLDRRLVNNSTTTFSYGGLQLRANAILDNEMGGTFDIQGDMNIQWAGGSPQINNKGLFVKSAGTGTSTVGGTGILFANTGDVEVRSGTLWLSAAYTQTAGATILNGGDLQKALLDLDGGQLRGTGTIIGDVQISAGAASPGLSAGTITITESYVQDAAGALLVEIGGLTPGSDYDRVDLSGLYGVTLDGTLDVSLIGGFIPVGGDSFTIMTFPSRTGTFSIVNLPYPGTDFDWQVEYTDTAVILHCLASSAGTIPSTVQVDKSAITPGDLTISWEPSCSVGGIDARIYEGTIGSFDSHQAIACNVSGLDLTEEVTPSGDNMYYLVVPLSATAEGSYGLDSTPAERPTGGSGSCSVLPQEFDPCP